MNDFSFVGRCGTCKENSQINIKCQDPTSCCIDLEIGNRHIECENVSSIAECLSNPTKTWTNKRADKTPDAINVTLETIYNTLRDIGGVCPENEEHCLPNNSVYFTHDASEINTAKCKNGDYLNYALLTDPVKTRHPITQMSYCDWLAHQGPIGKDPPIPSGGCYKSNGECMNDFAEIPLCGENHVCCPMSSFKEDISERSCDNSHITRVFDDHCNGYHTCKKSCNDWPKDEGWIDWMVEYALGLPDNEGGYCTCNSNADCADGV